jgi:hypothetical protein
MKLGGIAAPFRIDKPEKFRLADHDPADCSGLTVEKGEAKGLLAEGIERLTDLQERLYADGRWSVLIVLQAMDAGGKDSLIKHVMSGLNPQGVEVTSFKQPSVEELRHDFLWRINQRLPDGAGAQGTARRAASSRQRCRQGDLATTLRRYPRLRAPPCAQRHAHPQVLPQRLA